IDDFLTFTGTPTLAPSYSTFACPPGTTVAGTDRIGQIDLPANQSKVQCLIYFAKPFAKEPVCVANIGPASLESYFDEVPAIAVKATTTMAWFLIGKEGHENYSELKLNYYCFEIPEPTLQQPYMLQPSDRV